MFGPEYISVNGNFLRSEEQKKHFDAKNLQKVGTLILIKTSLVLIKTCNWIMIEK